MGIQRRYKNNSMPKTFKALENHKKVDSISYEPGESDVREGIEEGKIYWVYLKKGWCYDTVSLHTINGGTISEVKESMKDIMICNCSQCE